MQTHIAKVANPIVHSSVLFDGVDTIATARYLKLEENFALGDPTEAVSFDYLEAITEQKTVKVKMLYIWNRRIGCNLSW